MKLVRCDKCGKDDPHGGLRWVKATIPWDYKSPTGHVSPGTKTFEFCSTECAAAFLAEVASSERRP